eukprot:405765-Pyramimonas_sp.AAC.1
MCAPSVAIAIARACTDKSYDPALIRRKKQRTTATHWLRNYVGYCSCSLVVRTLLHADKMMGKRRLQKISKRKPTSNTIVTARLWSLPSVCPVMGGVDACDRGHCGLRWRFLRGHEALH